MRRIDKLKQIEKANILAEQRFVESKGLMKEDSIVEYNDMTQRGEREEAYKNLQIALQNAYRFSYNWDDFKSELDGIIHQMTPERGDGDDNAPLETRT